MLSKVFFIVVSTVFMSNLVLPSYAEPIDGDACAKGNVSVQCMVQKVSLPQTGTHYIDGERKKAAA